jgi:hypothetical protein
MTPTVWYQSARQDIVDKLKTSQYPEVQAWAGLVDNTDHSNHFEDFKHYLNEHDRYRELNFKQTFPELARYI